MDLVETAVGDAIMGSSLDMEMFMANELGSNLGGRIAGPLADYLNPQSKVPAPSTQQIKQDSLSPNDAQYLKAVAAAQGQGWSPDYLEPYLGSDDPDDVFNYYLAIRDASNIPAAQSNTRSQVTQNMLKQQANAARMQGIPVNYLQAMPDANQLDQFLNPSASNGVSRDNAMHFAGSSLNPADPHVAPDVWSQLTDVNQVNAWAAQHPNSLLPAPNSMARTTGNAQASWFRRDLNTFESVVGFAEYAMQHTSVIDNTGLMVGSMLVGAGEAEGVVVGARAVGSVVKGVMSKAGFFSDSAKVASEVENFAATTTAHPLKGWNAGQVIQHANELGLKTLRDQLILWSGLGRGEAGKVISQEYARANGGLTLEMTQGGRWLDQMDLFGINSPFTPQQATEIWANVSRLTVRQANGQVRSLLGQVQPHSIYMSQELLELQSNPNVLGVDELYLKSRFTFGSNY